MLNFTGIEIEGFGSFISKTFFSLDRVGLNIIRGKVGAGKTSIPSALYWCLYGSTLKKGSSIQTWEEYRGNSFMGTKVAVSFISPKGEKCKIIRCISYKGKVHDKKKGSSGIHIIINNEYTEIKGKKDRQSEIQNLIGYSPELFINSIVYGQRLKRIIEETGPNKKRIFDEAFETMFIDKAKQKAESERKDLMSLLNIKISKLESLNDLYKSTEQTLSEIENHEKRFDSDKKKRLKEISSDMLILEKETNKLKSRKNNLKSDNVPGLKEKIDGLQNLIENRFDMLKAKKDLNSSIFNIDQEISKINNQLDKAKSNMCHECGSELNKEESKVLKTKLYDRKSEKITKRADLWQKFISYDKKAIKKELSKFENEIKEYKETLSEVLVNEKLENEISTSIQNNLRRIDKYKTEYKEVKSKKLVLTSNKYKEKIISLTSDISKIESSIKKLEKQKSLYDWLIKEPLSNSGIKAYIFNTLLDKVNYQLLSYSEILGFNIEFGIDMATNTKDFYQVIYKGDLIIPYNDLSGGQKQLVDTSVALAIHDVISSVRPTNILFLDEPFEGLDNETIELVSEIINYKSSKQALYLITHHNSFNPTNANTLYFNLDSRGNTVIT